MKKLVITEALLDDYDAWLSGNATSVAMNPDETRLVFRALIALGREELHRQALARKHRRKSRVRP